LSCPEKQKPKIAPVKTQSNLREGVA